MKRKGFIVTTGTGFTLIELLIVVAIIAILAAIAVPNFLEAQTRAKVSRCKADERSIALALECYRIDANYYPEGLGLTSMEPAGGSDLLKYLTTPIAYMTSLPYDTPFGGYSVNAPNLHGYLYAGGGTKFFKPWIAGLIDQYHYFPVEWKNIDWYLLGMGPSKICSLNATNPAFTTPYDPTNGTVSIGDIIDIGGAGRSGGWYSLK